MKALLLKLQTRGRSKHVRRDERFLSLAQVDKLYYELTSEICMKRVRIGLFTDWNTHAQTLLMSGLVNLLVQAHV